MTTKTSFFVRVIAVLFTIHCSLFTASAQGWPANYGGVMLQGFYWDGYADSNWTTLEDQADEMSQYFSLIWVPNSAYANALQNNMGYHPVYWFDHKSAFGTEAELRSMINTFKAKNVGIIEDIVINHRASVDGNWLNFPAETWKGETYQLTAADICQDDESKDNGFEPTGAQDTGKPWGGARDLDHTSANVQKNVKAYLDFLLNDLGYTGFRYDFVLGYAPEYIGLYNTATNPAFSVMECWENLYTIKKWIDGTKVDDVIQSAAFDFPMKFNINNAFSNGGNWSKLDNDNLTTQTGYDRYSVTFVDNHDTGRKGESPLYANVEAANAYILTMPGTPCVWLTHWMAYKKAIKKMIVTRKAAGLTNQSEILEKGVNGNGYYLIVKGQNGNVMLLLGDATAEINGYQLATEGTLYKLYVSDGIDLTAVQAIDKEESDFSAPDFCQVNDGEICAFFEAPASWTTVACWAWSSTQNYTTGKWPGATCTKVGTNNGKNVWKWTWDGKSYKPNTVTEMTPSGQPTNIIFNNNDNGNQTSDLDFKNGGYYNQAGALQGVVTGISRINADTNKAAVYSLDGRLVRTNGSLDNLPKGVYIINGKKHVLK